MLLNRIREDDFIMPELEDNIKGSRNNHFGRSCIVNSATKFKDFEKYTDTDITPKNTKRSNNYFIYNRLLRWEC